MHALFAEAGSLQVLDQHLSPKACLSSLIELMSANLHRLEAKGEIIKLVWLYEALLYGVAISFSSYPPGTQVSSSKFSASVLKAHTNLMHRIYKVLLHYQEDVCDCNSTLSEPSHT